MPTNQELQNDGQPNFEEPAALSIYTYLRALKWSYWKF